MSNLNMDFAQRVLIDTASAVWQASPAAGVWRKPLAREAAEHGHASSIVRYDPGARFSAHGHPLGEEILVLDGVFSDETGDYPAGSYLRNPPGSSHAPFSESGCVLLVKLHQFQPTDTVQKCVPTDQAEWLSLDGTGIRQMTLHVHLNEQVTLLKWQQSASLVQQIEPAGEEIYVIQGRIEDAAGTYPAGSWLRQRGPDSCSRTAEAGTLLWRKTGHLLTAAK